MLLLIIDDTLDRPSKAWHIFRSQFCPQLILSQSHVPYMTFPANFLSALFGAKRYVRFVGGKADYTPKAEKTCRKGL